MLQTSKTVLDKGAAVNRKSRDTPGSALSVMPFALTLEINYASCPAINLELILKPVEIYASFICQASIIPVPMDSHIALTRSIDKGESYEAEITGIDDFCRLIVKDENGNEIKLSTGEISIKL